MNKYAILYNPLSDNGHGAQNAQKLKNILTDDECQFEDLTKLSNYSDYFASVPEDTKIVLAGGDGTLNHFINSDGIHARDIYYYPAGSGNDFFNDVGDINHGKPFLLTPYLQNLPVIEVNGMKRRFINGIGYGIDGYCCEEGDKKRATSTKHVNYTTIALKGLAYDFKPRNARVTVDGKTKEYHRVWMAPTMNGRYFGGGMMVTPKQDRLNSQHTVSLMVAHDLSRLKILYLFPYIFKGNHISHTEVIDFYQAHETTVEFDIPCALQIDGDTVVNVSSYSVHADFKAPVE